MRQFQQNIKEGNFNYTIQFSIESIFAINDNFIKKKELQILDAFQKYK